MEKPSGRIESPAYLDWCLAEKLVRTLDESSLMVFSISIDMAETPTSVCFWSYTVPVLTDAQRGWLLVSPPDEERPDIIEDIRSVLESRSGAPVRTYALPGDSPLSAQRVWRAEAETRRGLRAELEAAFEGAFEGTAPNPGAVQGLPDAMRGLAYVTDEHRLREQMHEGVWPGKEGAEEIVEEPPPTPVPRVRKARAPRRRRTRAERNRAKRKRRAR